MSTKCLSFVVSSLLGALLTSAPLTGATLEKLSIEEMSRRSTVIARGRVTSCAGESQGGQIYTRCGFNVSEYWKSSLPGTPSFVLPGGTSQGLVQTFTGTPRMTSGQEYVLFLWIGKSGKPQVIGLSQGVFDLAPGVKGGEARVRRAAASELMLDKQGVPMADTPMDVTVSELKTRVKKALADEVRQ